MPSSQRQILVTSALPYANGPIHLGHLVEYLQTDIWVRFQKMQGHECWYVCASDAHGTPIMLRAQSEGISAEELISRVHKEHDQDFADFLIEFDNFYTTHSEENRELSADIYTKLRDADHISRRTITQAYDPEKEMFLPDRFIKGDCPRCGTKDQYGDNCESCGASLFTDRTDQRCFSRLWCHSGGERVRTPVFQAGGFYRLIKRLDPCRTPAGFRRQQT